MSDAQTDYEKINEALVGDFAEKGISPDSPGFYDSPSFIKIEKQSPSFLNKYAYFVSTKAYEENYIRKAEVEIPFIAEILHGELVKDGRLGACIDVSMVLSRILEAEGYWNYIVNGALSITYPQASGIQKGYFYPVDTTPELRAGHAWLSAPPFSVIDITIKQQPYGESKLEFLPNFVFDKTVSDCGIDVEEVCSPDIVMYHISQGTRESDILSITAPMLSEISGILRPTIHDYSATVMKYIPVAVGAPDTILEKIEGLCLSGRYGIEIYNDIVKPALHKIR